MTRHDLQMWQASHVEKFFDERPGALLDPKQVRLAKISTRSQCTTKSMNPKSKAKSLDKVDPDEQKRCQATSHSRTICWPRVQVEVTGDGKHIHRNASIGILEVPNAQVGSFAKKQNILILNISRTHFHPKSPRELYIRLPTEDSKPGDEFF